MALDHNLRVHLKIKKNRNKSFNYYLAIPFIKQIAMIFYIFLSVTPRDANDDDEKLKSLKKGNLSIHLIIFNSKKRI